MRGWLVTCPPIHLCHSQAISRLVGSESRIRKVEAVNSRSYFLINSFTDLTRIISMQSSNVTQIPPGSSSFRHVRTTGVSRSTLTGVVQTSWLLHDEVTEPVLTVTLGQDQRKQEVKYYFAIVHRVTRDVCNEPVPKLCQCPIVILSL